MPIRIDSKLLVEGICLSIYEIIINNKQPVSDFMDRQQKTAKAKLMARIDRMVDEGSPHNEEIFKYEEDGIWALKSGQIRIYCFYESDRIILLTNGAIKKKNKADPQELARAKRFRNGYLNVFNKKGK